MPPPRWAGWGFLQVPCSHKANYDVNTTDIPSSPTRGPAGLHPPVVNPAAPAGSLLLFLEATLHCTLPWRNAAHARRSLLYRYSPKYLHFAGGSYESRQPEWVAELTPAQRAVLEPACEHATARLLCLDRAASGLSYVLAPCNTCTLQRLLRVTTGLTLVCSSDQRH